MSLGLGAQGGDADESFVYRTILSSAGNDGRVRLWKMTVGNVWRPAGHISVEQAEQQQGEIDTDMAVED